jgi:Lrp/AsnC family leucine-responsive transcriptional regulator
MQLTKNDATILALLQKDAGITMVELAEHVGLSTSSVQRRVQRLREAKVIIRDVSIIDPKKISPSITLLVELELEKDRPELLSSLHLWIARTAEVQQAWCLTGRGDYTLVMVVGTIEHFDRLAERMMVENPNVRKFTTSVALKTLKRTLELPI